MNHRVPSEGKTRSERLQRGTTENLGEQEEERENVEGKSERPVRWEAPNCLLQHVMTSLLHINLSLLRAISVSIQGATRLILRTALN